MHKLLQLRKEQDYARHGILLCHVWCIMITLHMCVCICDAYVYVCLQVFSPLAQCNVHMDYKPKHSLHRSARWCSTLTQVQSATPAETKL